jgi:hypothetical protein
VEAQGLGQGQGGGGEPFPELRAEAAQGAAELEAEGLGERALPRLEELLPGRLPFPQAPKGQDLHRPGLGQEPGVLRGRKGYDLGQGLPQASLPDQGLGVAQTGLGP